MTMDLRLIDYVIYILASVLLTVWVGDTLYRNGRPFLVSVFKEDGLADSVNRLLVVGFYLVNFGSAAILINTGGVPPLHALQQPVDPAHDPQARQAHASDQLQPVPTRAGSLGERLGHRLAEDEKG